MEKADLLGLSPSVGRGRGRPKGAKNKRSLDLQRFTDGAYGGSAAQQLASFCMIDRQELLAAKGDMMRARVRKAMRLCRIWKEEVGAGLEVDAAMKMIADGLKELMPYTDQRLAQLDVTSGGKEIAAPMIVVADAAGMAGGGLGGQVQDLIEGDYTEIEENQPLSLPGGGHVYQSKSTKPE
jgi:hypothetical protein